MKKPAVKPTIEIKLSNKSVDARPLTAQPKVIEIPTAEKMNKGTPQFSSQKKDKEGLKQTNSEQVIYLPQSEQNVIQPEAMSQTKNSSSYRRKDAYCNLDVQEQQALEQRRWKRRFQALNKDLKKLTDESKSQDKKEFMQNLRSSSQNIQKVRGTVGRSTKMRQTFNKVNNNINMYILYKQQLNDQNEFMQQNAGFYDS